MTIPISTHASSRNLTHHGNTMANHRSTKANNKDNGGTTKTSLHRLNSHQVIQRKLEEVATQEKPLSSQTDTSLEEAKASHLAKDRKHRVFSKGIASFVARQATVPLIVLNVVAFRLCLRSRSNPPKLTTLSWETECWATHHWL